MLKFLMTAIVALSLAGCGTLGTGGGIIGPTPSPSGNLVDRIIAGIRGACQFEVGFDTVVQIIGTFPGEPLASTIIRGVCASLKSASAVRGARPSYRGIVISAQKVR